MAIDYEMTVDGDLLRVRAWGADDDLESVMAYGLAVIQAANKHNCRRVLTDERELVYQLGTFDLYDLAKFYVAHTEKDVRAAIVCHPRYATDAAFWETVSNNRGLVVRAFTSLEEAERWVTTDL